MLIQLNAPSDDTTVGHCHVTIWHCDDTRGHGYDTIELCDDLIEHWYARIGHWNITIGHFICSLGYCHIKIECYDDKIGDGEKNLGHFCWCKKLFVEIRGHDYGIIQSDFDICDFYICILVSFPEMIV